MNYIYFCLLLGMISASAAEFKEDYPNITGAFKLNNDNYHFAKLDDNLWLPDEQKVREDVARGHDMPRICENLFYYYAEDFKQENVDFSVELEECGKANTTNMKSATKTIRAQKGSGAPGRTKRIAFNDGDLSPNANQAEYPWTVFIEIECSLIIYYEEPARGTGIYYDRPTLTLLKKCTGAIIHRQFILTAAHCIVTRDKNIRDNMAIKSPDHRDHNVVTDKYLQKVNESRTWKLKPGQVSVTSVWAQLTKISIYYGPISIDSITGKVNFEDGNEPIIIHGGDENVEVHAGYMETEEMLEMKRARDSGEQGLPQGDPPDWCTNDVAIIYLPQEKGFTFTNKVRPVCLPAPAGKHEMPDFKRCSMRYGEEFHLAGYGDVSEHPKIGAQGLSRLRAKVREVLFARSEYYSSLYGGVPRSFQDRNLSRKLKSNLQRIHGEDELRKKLAKMSKQTKGKYDKVIRPTGGDSGAPWLVQRYHNKGWNPEDTRIFAMAILSAYTERQHSVRPSISATDTLILGRWIRDTMIKFQMGKHRCQKWVPPGGRMGVGIVRRQYSAQRKKTPPPGKMRETRVKKRNILGFEMKMEREKKRNGIEREERGKYRGKQKGRERRSEKGRK